MGTFIRDSAGEKLDLPHFEHKLRGRSDALRAEIREALVRSDAERYSTLVGEVHDEEEAALADLLVDVSLAEITRHIQELRDIDASLRRITMGTYGTCVSCGESIGHDRLEAYPTAKRCVACQASRDHQPMAPPTPTL